MIIGFDGSRAFVKNRTGTENYSYQLLKHLLKIDTKNKYIVYLRSSVIPADAGIHTKNVQFKTINFPRLWTQIGLAARTFTDPLDVLFIPAHTSPLIHKKGLKTVVTVHDLGAEYLPKMHQLKQQIYLKYITKYQLKSATKLIAVSKATKEDLVEKVGIDPKKVEVVYEGFDNKLFKSMKSDAQVSSLIPFFLFVGTIQPRKNLTRIIEAFSCVLSGNDKLNLVIVGSKGWLADEIYNLPEKLGIKERVKFLGYVPDRDMPKLYSNAHALVFPSLFEGFGLPILEAQACGCPVVTSNTSSMPEVADKGAILVDPYKVDDIVRGIEKVMDPEIRNKLIKSGYENVKRFSWEKAARETLEILNES